MKKNCLQCNKEHKNKKFCCNSCKSIFVWNIKGYRKRMSDAHKGQIPTNLDWLIKYAKSNKGRKETSCRAKKRVGKLHPSWKGGITYNKKVYLKNWWNLNKEKVRNYNRKRRAIRFGLKIHYTNSQWEALKKKFNYMCLCCKKYEPEIKLTVDHIIPLSKGGSDKINNIQPLCSSCNSKKSTKKNNYLIFNNNLEKNG